MRPTPPYRRLFELLRQRSLSDLSVSRTALGLSDAVAPDVARDLLRRAARSWGEPYSEG
ncbi:hypothetical protein [Aestuariivita sp.]|uniref:hypothetical protein n=1 Tax=Aestuariivita sp. TaxID=1872407 RepID=UPI00216CD772|nr:hypothetical protein [Aestuariivita sp.]MCE8005632.1 hypothetical protein [Aestuariivita sp.]